MITGLRFGFHRLGRTASRDQARCHIHGTSHRIEWLVEQMALLGGLGSTDASVVVDSNLVVVVAVDSNLVAVAVDSNPVVEVADSILVAAVAVVEVVVEAVVEAVVVGQVDSTAFGLEPRDEGGPLLYWLQVRT